MRISSLLKPAMLGLVLVAALILAACAQQPAPAPAPTAAPKPAAAAPQPTAAPKPAAAAPQPTVVAAQPPKPAAPAPTAAPTAVPEKYPGLAAMSPIKLKYNQITGPDSVEGKAGQRFAEAVKSASNGKIEIEFFWSNSLLQPAQIADGIGSGVADMGIMLSAYSPSKMAIGNWLSQAGFLPSRSFPIGLIQGTSAHAEFGLNNDEFLREEFDRNGMKVLTPVYAVQQFDLLGKKPIRNLQEAKGIRVRIGGQTWANEAEAVGMVPVSLVGGELFEGFQRGIVDAAMVHPGAYIDFSLWDVGKYYMPLQFNGWNPTYIVINRDLWNKLPLGARQVLWDNIIVYLQANQEGNLAIYRRFATEGREKRGITFVEVDPAFQKAISDFQRQAFAKMPESAPKALKDPKAFLDSYQKANDRWLPIITSELRYPVLGQAPADWVKAYETEWDLRPWAERTRKEVFDPLRPK